MEIIEISMMTKCCGKRIEISNFFSKNKANKSVPSIENTKLAILKRKRR